MKEHPLRTWRINRRLKLHEVAAQSGIAQSYLSEIENWKKRPTLDMAERLAALTGKPILRIAPRLEASS